MRPERYDHPDWPAFRTHVLARDGNVCTVGRFLGGGCHATLDVHHLIPLSEGGALLDDENAITVCRRHHPQVEAIRRAILHRRGPRIPACRHVHRYDHARRECYERRLRLALDRAA